MVWQTICYRRCDCSLHSGMTAAPPPSGILGAIGLAGEVFGGRGVNAVRNLQYSNLHLHLSASLCLGSMPACCVLTSLPAAPTQIIGAGCSDASEVASRVTQPQNIPMISFASTTVLV